MNNPIGKLLGPSLNKRLVKRLADAQAQIAAQTAKIEALEKRNTCVAIRRDGRLTHWTFIADGAIVNIETIGLISDPVDSWRETLGIEA